MFYSSSSFLSNAAQMTFKPHFTYHGDPKIYLNFLTASKVPQVYNQLEILILNALIQTITQ